jgi:hypothetical protein
VYRNGLASSSSLGSTGCWEYVPSHRDEVNKISNQTPCHIRFRALFKKKKDQIHSLPLFSHKGRRKGFEKSLETAVHAKKAFSSCKKRKKP